MAKKPACRGVPVDQFMAQIDYAAQIRDGIREFLSDTLMKEQDFRKALEIPADRFRRAVDAGDFEGNMVKHQGSVFWGTAQNVAKIRKMQEVYR